MDAQTIRGSADRALMAEILAEDIVQDALSQLEQADEPWGTRRSLLATALRLTRPVAPELHDILDRCIDTLGVQMDVEAYVYPSAQFNAACTPPENGRVFILIASSLLEGFESDELTFVLGHELGHHVYEHHKIPLGIFLSGKVPVPVPLALKLTAWQRHAEISADRAGMVCAGTLEGAARSLFKLSSGLREAPNDASITAFLDQAAELFREAKSATSADQYNHDDWMSSHPFSPIRLKAAEAFVKSEAFVSGGTPLQQVEEEVGDLMALMEASYLEEDSVGAEAMRRLLFAAGAVVAGASNGVSKDEIKVLESLLGPGSMPRRINPELLREYLGERIAAVVDKVRPARRALVIRDLASIARADGHVDAAELAVMHEVARELGVRPGVVEAAIAAPTDLD